MTAATYAAKRGTLKAFFDGLGVQDTEAVRGVQIDADGLVTVKTLLRAPDGSFLTGVDSKSGLPVNLVMNFTYAEPAPVKEERIVQAYNTEMAWSYLANIVGRGTRWSLTSDTGARGSLRTFTFVSDTNGKVAKP